MYDLKLVYFKGCPNAGPLREAVREAGYTGMVEIVQDSLPDGDPLKAYSSPSLLVSGKVVFGAKLGAPSHGAAGGACSVEPISPDAIKKSIESVAGREDGR